MLSITFIKEEYAKDLTDIPDLELSCENILRDKGQLEVNLYNIWLSLVLEAKETMSATKFFFSLNRVNKLRLDLPYEELLINLPGSEEKLLYFKTILNILDLHVCDLEELASEYLTVE